MTRSPTPLSNKVASLFGSRAPLCDEHAGRRRAVRSKGLTTASSSAIAQAIDFPDISRAMSKLIVTFAILTINKHHGRCGRHCRNVRGLDTFWSVGL